MTKPVSELRQAIHTYVYRKQEEKDAQAALRKIYTPGRKATDSILVRGILEHGETDPVTGSIVWDFDEPIVTGDRMVTGLKWQRSSTMVINEERAQEVADSHEMTHRIQTTVMRFPGATSRDLDRIREVIKDYYAIPMEETEEFDYGNLYVLNQEGYITDEELDSVLEEEESWSLRITERQR
jgi:hypothetical protein